MKLGEKILTFITLKGISQIEFAHLCGWDNQGRVGHYIHGRREPNLQDIKIMAEVMETTPAWLAFDMGAPPSIWKETDTSIPALDQPFRFKVQNQAMAFSYPSKHSIEDGDIVEIDPHRTVKNGDVVALKLKNSKETILRKYIEEGNDKLLIPYNTHFKPINFEEVEKILGVVIHKMQSVSSTSNPDLQNI